MRSLYVLILVAMAIILSLSVLVFFAISRTIQETYFNPVFDKMDELEVQDASEALKTRGPEAVAGYLRHLDAVFGGRHYLLDASGKNVLTGQDQSGMLPRAPLSKRRGVRHGESLVAHRSADARYWFIAAHSEVPSRPPLYQYYLLVVGATGLLCWLAAIHVVRPIRSIASSIKRFGQGDLSARVQMRRRDEIGTLGESFDSMAERIQTLLWSEQRLLADVSHELRSPLARLAFSVKLARTATDREGALDRVKRDVDRLSSLVSGLVEMTRAEGDPLSRKSEVIPLSEIVSETIRDSAVEVEARGCNIRVDGQLSAKIVGDPELMRRVVENVLRNAIRHSPANGKIDVDVREQNGTVGIVIRDYGPGVPQEFVNRIFEPFFRVEEARDSETGGVGLGLSIAKRSVQLHGGTIEAHNAYPGLRVEITLPKLDSPPTEAMKPSGRMCFEVKNS